MLIIKHRVNTIEELKLTPKDLGVEIDIRPEGNMLILNHDPHQGGENFEEWLNQYQHAFVILNIKSEGIEKRVIEMVEKKGIKDYFLLDVTPPYMVKLAKQGYGNLSVRASPFEPINSSLAYAKAFPGKFSWVFIDVMTKEEGKTQLILNLKRYQKLKKEGYKICLVSPELLGREDEIEKYQKKIEKEKIMLDAVLTKKPDIWKQNKR